MLVWTPIWFRPWQVIRSKTAGYMTQELVKRWFLIASFLPATLLHRKKQLKNHGCRLFYAITLMSEVSFIDNDKHDLGTSCFGNSQKVAAHYSQYTSSSDSSKVSAPESTRRCLIMGYFLHEFFQKVISSRKFRLWMCSWNWVILHTQWWLKFECLCLIQVFSNV